MERKLNVADFATLVGATSKTIYQKISNFNNLPVNERLVTVKEKVKGREVTLISTSDEQIEFYKTLYGKNTVNNGEYYETLTEYNSFEPVNNVNDIVNNIQQPGKVQQGAMFDINVWNQFVTVNNDFNERYEQKITELIAVNNELAEVKGRQLLLEDKAGREGLYIKEINELKTGNEKLTTSNERLKYVIVCLLFILSGLIMYLVMVNNPSQRVNDIQQPVIETQKEPMQDFTPTPAQRRR